MVDLVTALPMGSDIPDWLLVAEPMVADAPRGNFRFAGDVHIIDTPDYFVVVPQALGNNPPLIDGSGMINHRIYAPGKPVHVVLVQSVTFPLEVNAWHAGGPGDLNLPPAPAPAVSQNCDNVPPVGPQVTVEMVNPGRPPLFTSMPKGFWARLRWLFLPLG